MVAVCVCVTFQSVHVAIEMQTHPKKHPILLVFNEMYGASSLAIILRGTVELYGAVWDCIGTVRGL